MKEQVTIGLPVYNAERFLRDTINSILNQSYKDFRLIILDDGSTDNSIQIIQSFNDSRIELIVDGQNKRLPYRLNQLARLTKTKYLARMDADDIMHVDRIKKQIDILEQNPQIDVLGSNAYSIDENNNINGVRQAITNKTELLKVKSFIHPTIIAKTSWFLNNPYDIKAIRMEDAELWFRTRDKYNFQVLTEPLLFYREFGSSYYKKYFKSLLGHNYIAKKLYESSISKLLLYVLKVYFPTVLKGFLYLILSLFNSESILINRRCVKLEKEQLAIAEKFINKITK